MTVHAGGIAWYGNYLYVADTSYGFRVFDLNHIWRVTIGTGWTLTTLTATGTNWLLGTTSAGTLRSYVVRGVGDWSGYTLDDAGWGFTHLTSPGAGIYYGRTSAGGLYHYVDGNPYNGSGSDIQYYLSDPVGSGWNQVLLSAQPFGT